MNRPLLLFVAAWVALTGAAEAAQTRRTRYLMGTLCEISAHGPQDKALEAAVGRAFDEIARLEGMMSNWRSSSEVNRLNRQGRRPLVLSPELFDVLSTGQNIARESGGAFDMTVGPLIELWDLRGSGRVPSSGEIARTRRRVGFKHLRLDPRSRSATFIREGMAVDLGGIAKGYALDQAAQILMNNGARGAMLNFGGQILVAGEPFEGRRWTIEIAHPARAGVPHRLELVKGSASTSSQRERFIESEGKAIGHVLDPGNGRPASFQGSVTVIAPTAVEADALSTALLVMDQKKGLAFIERQEQAAALYYVPGIDSSEPWQVKASKRLSLYQISDKQPASSGVDARAAGNQ